MAAAPLKGSSTISLGITGAAVISLGATIKEMTEIVDIAIGDWRGGTRFGLNGKVVNDSAPDLPTQRYLPMMSDHIT